MKKKQLIWQLFLSYQFIILTALLVVSLYTSYSVSTFFINHTVTDLKERAYLLSPQIRSYLSPLNEEKIDEICKKIGKSTMTRITVILPWGRVVGDSDEEPYKMENHAMRPEIRKAFTKGVIGISNRYSTTLQENIVYTALPLKQNDQVIAVLRTAVSVRFLENELRSIQTGIVLTGLIIALISTGISLLISRMITRPIVAIREGAKRFAKGELNHRLYISGSEEIGGLAEAMNQMAAQLNDRIQIIVQQRNELDAVLSSMKEGVMAVNQDERVISINQAAAQMFEKNPLELSNLTIQEVIRNPTLHKFVKKALSGEDPAQEDILFYHQGERILSTHHSPLFNVRGDHIGILIVFNDVTRLRRLENIRRDFAANVSHEIKTPLTAIKGFVETLQHGALHQPEEAMRFLGIIEKHVDRLVAIVEDLMNLSKIEQEKRKGIALETFSVREVILTGIQMCQSKAEEKKIQIDLVCDEGIVAKLNPPLMEQAVMNLLDNAIKYSEAEGVVRVEVSQTESDICIRFQDYGIGIDKVHLPRLFERFYRADKARSRKLGGTGLGLAIVKHIVQSHNGSIDVESKLGGGSCFTIHLPR